MRGLTNVTAEWTLLATAFNLRTLWRIWRAQAPDSEFTYEAQHRIRPLKQGQDRTPMTNAAGLPTCVLRAIVPAGALSIFQADSDGADAPGRKPRPLLRQAPRDAPTSGGGYQRGPTSNGISMSAWVPAFGGKMEEGSGMTGVMCGSTPRTLYLGEGGGADRTPLVFRDRNPAWSPRFFNSRARTVAWATEPVSARMGQRRNRCLWESMS